MKTYEPAANRLSTLDCLDRVRMRPDERRIACASLRQGELLADTLMRANDDLRRIFALVSRGIGALARGRKSSAAFPK